MICFDEVLFVGLWCSVSDILWTMAICSCFACVVANDDVLGLE